MSLLRENTNTGTRRLTSFNPRVSVLVVKKVSWAAALATLSLFVALNLCTAQTLSQSPSQGLSPSTFAPFAGAVIAEWKGSVQVQLPGGAAGRPTRGQNLPEGTALDTQDGRLVLVLRADESEIVVQPHTQLILVAPQPGNWNALEIILGKVRAYIRKRTGGAPPFQMGTPSAVIAVRGTRFDVEVNTTDVSEIDVFEGLVEVGSTTMPGAPVLVSPGMSTRVSLGSAPETPVPTREIRPDVEVPDQMAKLEFAREKALQIERLLTLSWEKDPTRRLAS